MLNNEVLLKLSTVESIGVTDEGKLVVVLEPTDKLAIELLKAKTNEELFEILYKDALTSIFSLMSKDSMKESIMEYVSSKYSKYGIDDELINKLRYNIKLKFAMLSYDVEKNETDSIKVNTENRETVMPIELNKCMRKKNELYTL